MVGAATEQRTAPRSEPTSEADAFLLVAGLTAVTTVLMLEATRVFVSYLVFVVDQSNRGTLAAISLGVFLATGLAGAVVRLLGTRRSVLLSAAGLALFRLVLQFWEQPEARLILGGAAIICWGWTVVPLLAERRQATAYGMAFGLGLDLAIRIAFRTVDLPWMPGAAAHVVTVVLVAAGAVAAGRVGRVAGAAETSVGASASLVALGPALVLYHLVTGNLGLAQERTELEFPSAAAILALGTILGVAGGAFPTIWSPGTSNRIGSVLPWAGVALVGAFGLWLFWQETAVSPVGMVVGAAASIVLTTRAVQGGGPVARSGVAATTFWFTAGMVLQVALLFAYYTYSGEPVVLVVAAGLLAAGALVAGRPAAGAEPARAVAVTRSLGALAVILAAVCGWWLAAWSDSDPVAPLGRDVAVMDYNIQTGFARDNSWDLEATARTIEAEDPDIVVLQEVSRGWLVTSGVDEVLWLSDRLDMQYVFGPSSGDDLWGNAILTRAPVRSAAMRRYETTKNLQRGVIAVQIETEAGDLWVFGTHLDNPSGAGEVRLAQINQLLAVWDGRRPAVVAGDLNATPDSDVLAALAAAGFADTGARLGPEATTSEDGRRIDYVLATSEIEVRDVRIPQVETSDHKPVVAELTVGS